MKRLTKSSTNKVIAGVCGGIAEYFDVDPILVRILWLLAIGGAGTGVLAYIICAIMIPEY